MWNKGKTNHKKISNPSCHYTQLQSCHPPSADANFTRIGKWSIKYRTYHWGVWGDCSSKTLRLALSAKVHKKKEKKKGQALSKQTTHWSTTKDTRNLGLVHGTAIHKWQHGRMELTPFILEYSSCLQNSTSKNKWFVSRINWGALKNSNSRGWRWLSS